MVLSSVRSGGAGSSKESTNWDKNFLSGAAFTAAPFLFRYVAEFHCRLVSIFHKVFQAAREKIIHYFGLEGCPEGGNNPRPSIEYDFFFKIIPLHDGI
jgi:hypothetical protein